MTSHLSNTSPPTGQAYPNGQSYPNGRPYPDGSAVDGTGQYAPTGTPSKREAAREVGHHAAQAGGDVAQTAKEQGREVVTEVTWQARNLYGEARDQLTTQAGTQQRRAAGGLRSLGDEMRTMAEQGGQTGPVSELARQAADRMHGVAGWLEEREPGDLVAEVRDYARRNPGTFLVGAALLGVLAGRLTRNVVAVGDSGSGRPPATGGPGVEAAETVPLSGYADQRAYAEEYAYGDERTAVLPPATPAPPAGGVLGANGTTPGGLPPATRTDPLPGVPSSGVQR